MKPLKILSVVLFSILLISFGSAATVYSDWSDGSDEKTINDGQSASFSVTGFSAFYPSITVDIKLYDSQNNLIHTYSNNQAVSNLCEDAGGNPISGTTCFYQEYSVTENTYENPGDYSIVSIVSDGASSQTSEINLHVNPVITPPSNNAPEITSSPVTSVDEEEDYEYQVTATDADGDSLSYSLTESPNWLSIDSNTGLISGTAPSVDSDTDYSVSVRVSDGTDTDSQSYTVTVNDIPAPVNNAPVAQNSTVTTDFETSTTISLQATDSDGDSLTFEIVSNPNDGAISGFDSATGQLTYTPDNGFSGNDFFTFKANDGQEDSNVATVSITVEPEVTTPNNPPVINSTPITSVDEGEPYSYQVTASDADGDTLTYTLTESPGFLTINSTTGLISGTAPSVVADKDFEITVSVTDGTDTDSQSYTLTVQDEKVKDDDDNDEPEERERHLILGTNEPQEEPVQGIHVGPSESETKSLENLSQKILVWLVMLTLAALIAIIAIYLTRRMRY